MTYEQLVQSAPVVLVEFFATWCPHCRRMMPIVADIKTKMDGRAVVAQFDIDQNSELAQNNDVQGVPTFLLYANGELVWRQSGELSESTLVQAIEDAMSS